MNPNQAQLEAWNGGEAAHYVHHADRYDRQLAEATAALMSRAAPEPDHSVVDVGCGCGVTTLAVAGAARRVVGVDLSIPMLDVAIARARAAGVRNVDFVVADAQTHEFGLGLHDLIISQLGVMFFDDPIGAFANLRRAMVPGGRMVFTTWQGLGSNDWLGSVVRAVARFTDIPGLGGLANGPGMFALDVGSEIADLLDAAGFSEIAVEPISPVLLIGGGGDLDDSVEFLLDMGIVRGLLERLAPKDREVAEQAVRAELTRDFEPGIGVRLSAGIWLVSARS